MGTTLGTGVMREFPIGLPKVMISSMASRNTRSFVGTRDILMLHSVCDLAGINRVTEKVLRNGALALAGMVMNPSISSRPFKPLIVMSCGAGKGYLTEAQSGSIRPPGLRIKRAEA
jgi:uncharacterized protein (UPF0261 family)